GFEDAKPVSPLFAKVLQPNTNINLLPLHAERLWSYSGTGSYAYGTSIAPIVETFHRLNFLECHYDSMDPLGDFPQIRVSERRRCHASFDSRICRWRHRLF